MENSMVQDKQIEKNAQNINHNLGMDSLNLGQFLRGAFFLDCNTFSNYYLIYSLCRRASFMNLSKLL